MTPELIERLLISRGLVDEEARKVFLYPDYDRDVHNPFLLSQIEPAGKRILAAMDNQERIVIYTDYDTDGIPGGVILHDYFKKVKYEHVRVYTPHRVLEGFGLNVPAIEEIADSGATLIITVDCGSTDTKEVDRARALGVDVIITDHHVVPESPPAAIALVNPKQKDDIYPNKDICGAGVAFQLVRALIALRPIEGAPVGWEKWLLDMVAIATLSDMVPLVGENRAFARYGLQVMRKTFRPGIRALLKRLRIDQKTLTEDDIGFGISPRINAASRMGVPERAFRLLATESAQEAETLARELDLLNNKRKGVVASLVKEVRKRLAHREINGVIVLGDPSWKPSLLGLVANTLMGEYGVPVFLWGREDGSVIKGSCRSPVGYNVMEIMERAHEHFLDKGGHDCSGGFSVSHEQIHFLEEALVTVMRTIPKVTNSTDTPHVITVSLTEISDSFLESLETLRPFGEGNKKPYLKITPVQIKEVASFGKSDEHVRMVCVDDKRTKREAIAFFKKPTDFAVFPEAGKRVTVMGNIESGTFMGRTSVRIRILDIVMDDSSLSV